MVSNNPQSGRQPGDAGRNDALRGFLFSPSTPSQQPVPPSKPLPPLKPMTSIAKSSDGDHFETEQPSLSQGPPPKDRKKPGSPEPKPRETPAKPQANTPATPKPRPGDAASAPKLRLVGQHVPQSKPQNGGRNRIVRKPPAQRNTPEYSTSTPFGSTEPAMSSISASGVMMDMGPIGQPINSASDPRWVLAIRTAESLQGSILGPEKRQQLIRLGKVMGMTAFDANLVIAIIQDQARRGYAPDYCPTAGEPQLQMVPLPAMSKLIARMPGRRALILACVIASVLAAEVLFFHLWLG